MLWVTNQVLLQMSSHTQLQANQQEIDSVKAKIQHTKQDLATAEQGGDGDRVDFLRRRLEQMDRQLSSLREQQTILLRGQAPGQHCLPCHHLAGLPVYNCLLVSCRPHTMLDTDSLTLLASNLLCTTYWHYIPLAVWIWCIPT